MATPPPAGGDEAPGVARAALSIAAGPHGVVGPLNPSQEEWCEYTERLSHYFVANDIVATEKMQAILLTAVGPATYRLLNTRASPQRLDELQFAELVDLPLKHYNPKPLREFTSTCIVAGSKSRTTISH